MYKDAHFVKTTSIIIIVLLLLLLLVCVCVCAYMYLCVCVCIHCVCVCVFQLNLLQQNDQKEIMFVHNVIHNACIHCQKVGKCAILLYM